MSISPIFLDFGSFFLFTLVLFFLSVLSRRLGEVMGIGKFYYLYYMGIIFTLLGSIIMAFTYEVPESKFYGYVSFSIGLTLGFIASIRYWGWLIKELFKG